MGQQLKTILSAHKRKREEIIPILQEIQAEFSYLPTDALLQVARYTRAPESRVYGIATFYAQFRFTPMGQNHIMVCRGTACHVGGASQVIDEVEERIGIKEGETSSDGEFSVETVSCIGTCGLAPTMVVNDVTYGRLTRKEVGKLISQFQAQAKEGQNGQ